jgi:hypothetical protein
MVTSVFISFMTAMKDTSADAGCDARGETPLQMFGYAMGGRLEDASVIGVITVLTLSSWLSWPRVGIALLSCDEGKATFPD